MDFEYNSIDFKKTELENLRLQNLSSAPADGVEGMMYADTTEHKPKYHNGTGFVDVGGGSGTTYTFAEGETNGAFNVTPDGGNAQSVPVHGLNNAAYKDVDTAVSSSSTNVPTSSAVASYVDAETADKVDKVTGKGLSTNDLTDALKANYDAAYTAKHTHSNKAVLDTVTADIVNNSHTHSNKTVLDGISQTDIDNWDSAASASGVKVYHSLAELNISGTVTIATIHAAMEVGSILAAEVSGLSSAYFPAGSGMLEGKKYSATQSSFKFHQRLASNVAYSIDHWFNFNSSTASSAVTSSYWTQAMTKAEKTKISSLGSLAEYKVVRGTATANGALTTIDYSAAGFTKKPIVIVNAIFNSLGNNHLISANIVNDTTYTTTSCRLIPLLSSSTGDISIAVSDEPFSWIAIGK